MMGRFVTPSRPNVYEVTGTTVTTLNSSGSTLGYPGIQGIDLNLEGTRAVVSRSGDTRFYGVLDRSSNNWVSTVSDYSDTLETSGGYHSISPNGRWIATDGFVNGSFYGIYIYEIVSTSQIRRKSLTPPGPTPSFVYGTRFSEDNLYLYYQKNQNGEPGCYLVDNGNFIVDSTYVGNLPTGGYGQQRFAVSHKVTNIASLL